MEAGAAVMDDHDAQAGHGGQLGAHLWLRLAVLAEGGCHEGRGRDRRGGEGGALPRCGGEAEFGFEWFPPLGGRAEAGKLMDGQPRSVGA